MKFLLYRQTIIPAYNKFWRESHYHRMWVCKEEEEAEAEEVSDRKSTILMFPRKNSPPFEDHKTEEECALTPWWGGGQRGTLPTHSSIEPCVHSSTHPSNHGVERRTVQFQISEGEIGKRLLSDVQRPHDGKSGFSGAGPPSPARADRQPGSQGWGGMCSEWVGVSLDGWGGGEGRRPLRPSVRPSDRAVATSVRGRRPWRGGREQLRCTSCSVNAHTPGNRAIAERIGSTNRPTLPNFHSSLLVAPIACLHHCVVVTVAVFRIFFLGFDC